MNANYEQRYKYSNTSKRYQRFRKSTMTRFFYGSDYLALKRLIDILISLLSLPVVILVIFLCIPLIKLERFSNNTNLYWEIKD